MKIFIFGSNGMLGNYVKSYLSQYYQIIPLTRNDYDLTNLSIESLNIFLLNKQLKIGDVVINCAGIIPQSLNKENKQRNINIRLYFIINSIFPIVLSMICSKYQAKMIHITTDCVFSGKDGNYDETSLPDEINDYGMSKSLGEICDSTIIRTSIIGEEINNKRSLLEWVKSNKGKEINGYINHYWNGVTCLQLAKIIYNIIEKQLYWKGIRHIFSNTVSKYELISMINDIYDLNIKINKYETEKVDKTLKSNYLIFDIPNLSIQIEELKNYLNP